MPEFRLGDVIDDHCIKCRRITNHSIVSIVTAQPAKVRCRTCYHDHDYRHEQAPPSKKDLKKAELFKEVLAAAVPGSATEPELEVDVEVEVEEVEETEEAEEAEEAEEVVVEEPAVEKAVVEKPKKGKARGKKA